MLTSNGIIIVNDHNTQEVWLATWLIHWQSLCMNCCIYLSRGVACCLDDSMVLLADGMTWCLDDSIIIECSELTISDSAVLLVVWPGVLVI